MFWGKVLEFLDTSMTTPQPYGVFHLVSFALAIIVGVLLCIVCKDTARYARRIAFITAVIVTVLEIYKQINYTFTFDGTAITADYQWYAFPWCLIIYIAAFTLATYLMLLIAMGIKALVAKKPAVKKQEIAAN